MKAISLWEPWASLMMLGAKKNETRSWPTKYRGPLLICAAKGGLSVRNLRLLLHGLHPFAEALQPLTRGENRPISIVDLNHGKALCIVDLIECIPTEDFLTPRNCDDTILPELRFGNYTRGRFCWITTNLRVIESFPVKGKRRFFEVELPHDGGRW